MKTDHLTKPEQIADHIRRLHIRDRAERKRRLILNASYDAKLNKAILIRNERGRNGRSMTPELLGSHLSLI